MVKKVTELAPAPKTEFGKAKYLKLETIYSHQQSC